MSETIPVFTDLSEVYGQEGAREAQERYAMLARGFQERYGAAPELFARSPGRVNLIGEHIDYEGYGVLPMALKQDTIVAIRKAGDKLVVGHLHPKQYATYTFSTDPSQEVDTGNHSWANYFMCAYKGVYEHLAGSGTEAPPPVGLQILVEGRVPQGGGLSSSAALVCSASLALLGVHGIRLSKQDVATFTAKCEKYVGTESGGMDQAISIMAKPGTAMLVEFNPVRAADVSLPEGATFVIANSLTVSAKAETAATRYNMRVVECRLAAAVLALGLGQSKEAAARVETLREVEPLVDDRFPGDQEQGCIAAVEKLLHEAPYEHAELEALLGISLPDFFHGNASQLRVLEAAAGVGGFQLRKRALHVFAEAERVHAFRAVCNGDGDTEAKMAALGELMDKSQGSCRDLYQCSCAELDELVGVCKEAGALGSRLTGAGWGGCTVSLIHESQADAFIEHVKARYFSGCLQQGKVRQEDLGAIIFASKPSSGGAVLKIEV